MEAGFLRHGIAIYVLTNVGMLLACGFGVAAGNATAGSAFYVIMLVLLCSVPLLWMRRFNDRYALLAIFMGCYFLLFGALSLQTLVLGSDRVAVGESDAFVTAAQLGVLLGAVFVLAGYRLGCSLVAPLWQGESGADWSNLAIVGVGAFCWIFGSLAFAYYAIVVTPENSVRATEAGLQGMGPLLTFAVMLGYLVQPLGVVMLAYGYAKNRTRSWLGVVVVVVALQLFLGFITDTKETAALGIVLVAITQTLWDNKLPKGWMVGIVAFAILVFPVLQAARVERGEHGLDRARAFDRFADVLALAWESRDKKVGGESQRRSQTFLERTSKEASLEPIFERVGVDTPFLHGQTLVAIPFAFVPRLLLPDKEDVPVGQLYNHVFQHASSDDFTFISFSQLGEFYRNFGWPGVIAGMLLIGIILGYSGAKSSLAEVHSITRLLIALICIKALCLGFEHSISISFVVWMRGMAAVGLLHLIFARQPVSARRPAEVQALRGENPAAAAALLPRFPNIMR